MIAPYEKGKEYFLKLDDSVVIGPFAGLWKTKEEDDYIYGSFSMTDAGYAVRNNCDYRLLSHGVFWMYCTNDGQFVLQKNNGEWILYNKYEIEERVTNV